jgi:hypothetical protein
MTDIESRLREAMRSVSVPAPAGLIDMVRARRRRHIRRAAAAWAAAAVVLAAGTPAIAHGVQQALPRRSAPERPAGRAVTPVSPIPSAAPGTLVLGCHEANPGQVAWRASTPGRLGNSPVWYLSGGHSAGKVELYSGLFVIAGMRPGSTVLMRVASDSRGTLLFEPSSRPLAAIIRYAGEDSGVMLTACSAEAGSFTEPGNVTVYRGAFQAGAGRCVPVDIWWTGHPTPVRGHLGACGGSG